MRFFPKVSALALAALLAVPVASAAENGLPGLTNPTQIIDSATVEVLAQTLREVNAGDVQTVEAGGKKGVKFKDGDIPYSMVPVFCDIQPGKCLGFVMLVVVDNSELKFSLDTLNSANKMTSLVTFFREENNRFTVARVNLVDGGVSKKNIAATISISAMEFRETMKKLQSQLTVSLNGPFQHASNGPARLRAYAPDPVYASRLADMITPAYQRRFGKR